MRIHLAALDLNLLVALDRLLATGSVSVAARELGVTQPAMSRTLARLREVLGDPLFVREGRLLVATERARSLRQPVGEALAAAYRVFEPPSRFDPQTSRGEVSLALGDEAQTAFAEPILTALSGSAPLLDVRIRRLGRESATALRRGELDLVLVPDMSALPASVGHVDLSDFVLRRLYERRWVVASAGARRRWTLESYAGSAHLLVAPEGGARGFVDDYLAERGLARRVAATVTSFDSAAQIVARTSLIATLPEEVVRSVPGIAIAKPPFAIPSLPMMLAWHPRATTDARHKFVRERIAEAVRLAS